MTPPDAPGGPVISSTSNPRVRAAVALRDRAERDRTGLTLVDGAREARRALAAGVRVEAAYVCEERIAGPDARAVLDRLGNIGAGWTSVSASVLARMAYGGRDEGLVLAVQTPATDLARLPTPVDSLYLVIEGIEKPGNIGAVLRSADGAGVTGVIAANPATDLFNPNAIRASAGTIFDVPLAAGSSDDVIAWARLNGLRIVTATVDATTEYSDIDLTGPLALVLGAESDGLSDRWIGPDVQPVRIPMAGIADSLNVSIAAAILAYEARRQRNANQGGRP